MQAATVSQIKKELAYRSHEDLLNVCLRLVKHKKENKELATYLLFESENEENYIRDLKQEIDEQFEQINYKNYYYIKKGVRKILASIKKHIKFSPHKETEVELLIYYCLKLKEMKPSYKRNKVLQNSFDRQLEMAKKKIDGLEEDLQYDYLKELAVFS